MSLSQSDHRPKNSLYCDVDSRLVKLLSRTLQGVSRMLASRNSLEFYRLDNRISQPEIRATRMDSFNFGEMFQTNSTQLLSARLETS